MIEEKAIVTRIENGSVWLKGMQSGACGGCCQQSQCSTATLAKTLPKRELKLKCDLPFKVGDQVSVAIDDSHLVLGSFLLYIIPLLCMFAGVLIADALLTEAENWLIPISLVSLLAGFGLIKHLQPIWFVLLSTPQIFPLSPVHRQPIS
jgi:sigma-E factor negative regulatory protein RseC